VRFCQKLSGIAGCLSHILEADSPKPGGQLNEKKEMFNMASNSNRGNQALVPEAREGLNKFKMESASDFDVTSPS
jgi:hypothetical protein